MHFVMDKLRLAFISWTERVFCSSIIDYLIRIDGSSSLNEYCSLMFLCMFLNVFIKLNKHVFMYCICKLMFVSSMTESNSACKPTARVAA